MQPLAIPPEEQLTAERVLRFENSLTSGVESVYFNQVRITDADLKHLKGLTSHQPDANFVFCRLPDDAPSGPEVTRALFVEHNILIKHCARKTMPDSNRYLRIASRTNAENRKLAEALAAIIDSPAEGTNVDG